MKWFVSLLLMACLTSQAFAGVVRTLNSAAGTKIEAEILSVDAAGVNIRRLSDNRNFKVPFKLLSEADKAYYQGALGSFSRPIEMEDGFQKGAAIVVSIVGQVSVIDPFSSDSADSSDSSSDSNVPDKPEDILSPGAGAISKEDSGKPNKLLSPGAAVLAELNFKRPAKLNDVLTPGSTVFTGPNSEAILLFSNGATSTLGPDSTVLIEGFVQKEFEGSDKTVGQFAEEISSSRLKLDLDVGELILNVKKLKKDSSLIISTPMGMAGVRGTHFKVAVSKDASSVGVLSGAVDFLNLQNQALPLGKGTKLESTNQTPSRQFALPPGEKTRIETATLAARQKTAAFSLVKLSQAFAEINPGQGAVGGDLKGGDLWILMHVDGSGSILETRKSLEAMRGTIMKKALLPFYMNDPNLYERRVQVVDGQGERTLQFFAHAAKKENVLAMVFQDEAQPVYHMPNFNKQPSKQYAQDLTALKQRLTGRAGLYRGVMLQVDRGKTPAKSFVEFVQNAWQGGGYLRGANLQKYYWKENKHHVLKQTGTVFSDVYQVKDDGDPTYYLNLIFKEAKKVGLDLEKLSR